MNRDLPPQFADVAVLDEQGRLWIPDGDGEEEGWYLHTGLRVRCLRHLIRHLQAIDDMLEDR